MINQINPANREQSFNDKSFYQTLIHYQPFSCCSNRHKDSQPVSDHQIEARNYQIDQQQQQQQPHYQWFLINQGWWRSFICMIAMNVLFVMAYLKFVLDTRVIYQSAQNDDPAAPTLFKYVQSSNYLLMKIICVVSLLLIDISYLLTQFLNPGIENLSLINLAHTASSSTQLKFCNHCNQYVDSTFTHCSECRVCIHYYDHHCGFFGKCIGGKAQKYSFFGFIATVTIGFIALLVSMAAQLGDW